MVTAPFERQNPQNASQIPNQVEGELSEVPLIDEREPFTTSKKSPVNQERSQTVNSNDLVKKPNDSDSQASSLPTIRNALVQQGGIEINTNQPKAPRMQSVIMNKKIPTILRMELSGNWLTKHILFVIRLPTGVVIKRRFSDFIWLRNYLTRLYTGAFIPPLPERLSIALWPDGYLETRKF